MLSATSKMTARTDAGSSTARRRASAARAATSFASSAARFFRAIAFPASCCLRGSASKERRRALRASLYFSAMDRNSSERSGPLRARAISAMRRRSPAASSAPGIDDSLELASITFTLLTMSPRLITGWRPALASRADSRIKPSMASVFSATSRMTSAGGRRRSAPARAGVVGRHKIAAPPRICRRP